MSGDQDALTTVFFGGGCQKKYSTFAHCLRSFSILLERVLHFFTYLRRSEEQSC